MPHRIVPAARHGDDVSVVLEMLHPPFLAVVPCYHVPVIGDFEQTTLRKIADADAVCFKRRFLGREKSKKRAPRAVTQQPPLILSADGVAQVMPPRGDVLDVDSHRMIGDHGRRPASLV